MKKLSVMALAVAAGALTCIASADTASAWGGRGGWGHGGPRWGAWRGPGWYGGWRPGWRWRAGWGWGPGPYVPGPYFYGYPAYAPCGPAAYCGNYAPPPYERPLK